MSQTVTQTRPSNIPADLTSFVHAGVRFERQTATHEPGVYTATDRLGRVYTVKSSGGSKRYPVQVIDQFGNCDRAKTLLKAAEWIAALAARRSA